MTNDGLLIGQVFATMAGPGVARHHQLGCFSHLGGLAWTPRNSEAWWRFFPRGFSPGSGNGRSTIAGFPLGFAYKKAVIFFRNFEVITCTKHYY